MDEDLKDLVMRTMKEGRQYDSDLVDAIEKLVPSSKPVDLTDRVELSMVALRLAMALAVTKGLFNQIVDNCINSIGSPTAFHPSPSATLSLLFESWYAGLGRSNDGLGIGHTIGTEINS